MKSKKEEIKVDKGTYQIFNNQPAVGQVIGDRSVTYMEFHGDKAEITTQHAAGIVDLDAYQQEVRRTCATEGDRDETIKMALIGLQGELGEIAEPLKKALSGTVMKLI